MAEKNDKGFYYKSQLNFTAHYYLDFCFLSHARYSKPTNGVI